MAHNVAKWALVFVTGTDDIVFEPVVTGHARMPEDHDPFTAADVEALATALFRWWTEVGPYGGIGTDVAGATIYPPQLRLNRVEVRAIEPVLGPAFTYPAEDWAGYAISVDPAFGLPFYIRAWMQPPACALCITTRTDTDTRSGRGRLYLPAPDWSSYDAPQEPGPRAAGIVNPEVKRITRYSVANLAWWIRNATPTEFEMVWCVYSRLHRFANAILDFEIADYLRTVRPRAGTNVSRTPFGMDGETA